MNEQEHHELEVVQPSVIESIERAQVDIQIATARRYPRIISAVKQRMLSYATLDEETAAGCFYTLPPRKDKDGKMTRLQGPSVRLAEIALASYQHVKAGSRIISDDGKFITAQSVVHDLENNVSVSIEVKRRVTTRDGNRFSDDMIATTGNAAISIALRNAIFRVVPRALITPVYEQAKKVAVGDVKSLVSKRSKIIERLGKMGVTVDRILHALGVAKVDDIGLDHMETLIGHGTSLKDGEFSVEELFPIPGAKDDTAPSGPVFKRKKAEPAPEPESPKQDPVVEVVSNEVAKQAEQVVANVEQLLTTEPQVALSETQSALSKIVTDAGGNFDSFIRACVSQDPPWMSSADAMTYSGFESIPDAVCAKFIGAKRGVATAVKREVEKLATA